MVILIDPIRIDQKQQIIMPQVTITIVPKEIGQLWDQILELSLNDICKPPVKIPDQPLTQLITHQYNSRLNVHHGKSYQQYTGNLCGYHSIYNTLCFLNTVKKGYTHYDILSGASFWSFKKKMERFLMEIKHHNKLRDEWPWREQDILFGDFQRTYNKLCLEYFQDFDVFRDHDQFQLFSCTWEFQYQNLLLSQEKRKELNQVFAYFKNYKKDKPLVVSFMLAITNHWMCLLAVKSGNQTQYWFFDSSNRQFLDLNQRQIQEYVKFLDEERVRFGRQRFSNFFKENMAVCMKDTQISLKLIIDCLEGKTTLDEYTYNQQFNIFANEIEKFWDVDQQGTELAIKEYWYNITAFFRVPVQYKLFTERNRHRFDKLVKLTHNLRHSSEHGARLNNLVKKYSNQTNM